MIFDKEQWGMARDSQPRVYCHVFSNTVAVWPLRGTEREVHVKVPSDLFSFARGVLHLVPGEVHSFSLEEVDGGSWVLSLVNPEGIPLDLWLYRALPGWAM